MTKIFRQKPPRHVLVPDTNILWHEDKGLVVAPDFEKFWSAHVAQFELTLLVPEVVRGELLFQQVCSALKALAKANEGFSRVGVIAEKRYRHRISEQRVRTDVEKRLDRWIAQTAAGVEPTPYDTVDWRRITHCAIWHEPPFSDDPKNQDIEKGFKDALVAETLWAICERVGAKAHIAFVSKDGLLRQSVEKQHRGHQACFFYESVDDFASYLRLTKEKLTEEFIRAIQARATSKFYADNDLTSLIFASDVVNRIRSDFPSEFALPTAAFGKLQALAGATSPAGSWEAVGDELVFVVRARFERLEADRIFHWKSKILFGQYFRYVGQAGLFDKESSRERLRTLEFDVNWRARVKSDGRFHDQQVTEIVLESKSFAQATAEQVRMYGPFPSLPFGLSAPSSGT